MFIQIHVNGWTDGWVTDGRTDGWMDGRRRCTLRMLVYAFADPAFPWVATGAQITANTRTHI